MNIIQIIPGSGGTFYCGNCLRDSKYIEALRKDGHHVVKIPMYLPLFADKHDISSEIPVFYGAISIYLKQLFPFFRRAPRWFDKLLNSKPMMKLAASMAGSTNAKGLDEMTISMLMGEDGRQNEELERMANWIAGHCTPDIIHISNALLLGLARRLKQTLNVPVVCSLQDEDVWVDIMDNKARSTVWQLMSEKAENADAFIAVSHYFGKVMQKKMNIPSEKLFSIYLGVDPEEYRFINSAEKGRNIGFISRMCYGNGLDILVKAFARLKKKPGFNDVKLIITGGSTGADTRFVRRMKREIKKGGFEKYVEFHKDFENEGRHIFFSKVSVISVPVRNGEAFGMYLLEAMASGIPVVQPDLGAFPEIVESVEGGIIYKENTPELLAQNLETLLTNPDKIKILSRNARNGVMQRFNIYAQAKKMAEVYNRISTK